MAEYHSGELIARMLQAEDHVFRRGGACRGFNQAGVIGQIGKGLQAVFSSERVWDLMGGA